tara:strand:- start:621 stop:1160 length:540 start_codon:yes stop_codon:yes gene_type:complete
MKVKKTGFKDLLIIEPELHLDTRGFFKETYNEKVLNEMVSYDLKFCQDNLVKSSKNVLRGLHFQKFNYAQSKLIQVISGKIIDVVVDLRPNSNTYLKYFKIELSAENSLLLFIPKGFAHGYLSLADETIVHYKVDEFYNATFEEGINFRDPKFNIDWEISFDSLIISEKDKNLKFFNEN